MGDRRVTRAEVERVYRAWLGLKERPDLCKLTQERRDLIRARLRLGYEVEDLEALFQYAAEADEAGPRWWRGDNPRRKTYLDLDQLLRKSKLARRVEAALLWADRGDDPDEERPAEAGEVRSGSVRWLEGGLLDRLMGG